MQHLTDRKPGAFRAVCQQASWTPYGNLTHEQLTAANDNAWPCRWDRKLDANVVAVPCSLDTTDRATFEAHVAEAHADRGGIYASPTARSDVYLRTHRLPIPVPVKMWKAPRLTDEGKPYDDHGALRTCPTCTLVSQVEGNAGELWWDEHVRGCALAQAGAAS